MNHPNSYANLHAICMDLPPAEKHSYEKTAVMSCIKELFIVANADDEKSIEHQLLTTLQRMAPTCQ